MCVVAPNNGSVYAVQNTMQKQWIFELTNKNKFTILKTPKIHKAKLNKIHNKTSSDHQQQQHEYSTYYPAKTLETTERDTCNYCKTPNTKHKKST